MSTQHHSSASDVRPRVVCRIVRLRGSLFGRSEPRHVLGCPDCRRYFAAAQNFDSALRREAATTRLLPSGTFEEQLISAVRDVALETRVESRSRGAKLWPFGGLIAAVAAIAVIFALRTPSQPSQDSFAKSAPSPADGAAVITSAVQSLSTGLVTAIPSAGEVVAHNPLQKEIGSVYSDMKSALDFLALNFLPTTAPAQNPPQTRQI